MAAITIRDLDEQQMAQLRARAKYNDRSLEDEARALFTYANDNEGFSLHARVPDFTGPEWGDPNDDAPQGADEAAREGASQSRVVTWETVTDEQLREIIAEGSTPMYCLMACGPSHRVPSLPG